MKVNVKVLVLRTAGTNCDTETCEAFILAGASPCLIHINELKKRPGIMKKYHIMAIPGGFTYGDDIASGRILANEIKCSLADVFLDFASAGKLMIGICNGFQVMVKLGLLPAAEGQFDNFKVEATLTHNDPGKFISRWVHLESSFLKNKDDAENGHCDMNRPWPVWTSGLPGSFFLPIAHAEGKFIPRDDKTLRTIENNRQVVLRYCRGRISDNSPHIYNPNGSINDIAGVTDPTGRLIGMMPHPERYVTYLQHPDWRRDMKIRSLEPAGLSIFRSGVRFAEENLI